MPNEHQCSPRVGKHVQYCALHTDWQDPEKCKESDRFSGILHANCEFLIVLTLGETRLDM